jgi:murein L,D-transpeptidase YafK
MRIAVLALLIFLTDCSRLPPTDFVDDCDGLIGASVDDVDTMRTRIVIDKSAYTLEVFEGQRRIRCFPVVLGFDAVHDKRREGDGCTPEGTFKVRTKYDHAKWRKFIWIDYPTADSWRKFNARKAAGEIHADATIGGDIGIHGVPEGRDDLIAARNNWTWGCISLTRPHVDDLYGLIRTGTEILIRP